MMKPFFSVLVPIYNVEKYLMCCLDSLINQTLHNIQIICINDGSSDNSLNILKMFAQRDDRIHVIHQENKGYGAALNKGFQYIQADYTVIVEPDDFLAKNAFELFFNEIQSYPYADIIKHAYWNFLETHGERQITPSSSSQLALPDRPFRVTQYPQLLLYHPSIWTCNCFQ